jgi:hypothetical protein
VHKLAKAVIEARKSIPFVSLDTLTSPPNFDLVVESTGTLCRVEKGNYLNFGSAVGYAFGLFVCMASLRHISAIWLLVPEC